MNGLHSNYGIRSNHPVNEYSISNFHNPMEVARSFHADMPNVFWIGKNSMVQLTSNPVKAEVNAILGLSNLVDSHSDSKELMKYQLQKIKESKALLETYEQMLREELKD